MTQRTTWCDCQGARVEDDRCDGCDPSWLYDDDPYEDPPLYPAGKLAGMTLPELERELERQGDRQGRLGDAEHIDERAVEDTEARWRLVDNEIKRRGDGDGLKAVLADALSKGDQP